MPNGNGTKPLGGYRVLDFMQKVAGPLAGQVLAAWEPKLSKWRRPADNLGSP